jgi:hypothetical protein
MPNIAATSHMMPEVISIFEDLLKELTEAIEI